MMLAGAMGTASGVMHAARAFGISPHVEAQAPIQLRPVTGRAPHVLILGAGISGLVAAYELKRAGYRCTLLEASHRAGGRNLTLRHGDRVDELGGEQICRFDDQPNLYFNPGPARIPAEHTGVMHYCRELHVPLQFFCNYNRNCYAQDDKAFKGKPIRLGEFHADLRGFMAELMNKSLLSSAQLDAPFDDLDKDRLVAFLHAFGELQPDGKYHGGTRAGLSSSKLELPKFKQPHDFKQLLASEYGLGAMHFAEIEDQGPAMMTPVGGMDRIVTHFLEHVDELVTLGAAVTGIKLTGSGVQVQYQRKQKLHTVEADYCLNCIPTHILNGIENNFPAEYSQALTLPARGKLLKIGLQARERFWEEENIFGGISWTHQDITQIWYPEHGTFMPKGILLGAYSWEPEIVNRIAALSPSERIELAVRQGEKVHSNYRQYIETGVSVCWHRMNHLLGCGSYWTEDTYAKGFNLLQAPAGRHYMMGDQLSTLIGWQEGAVRSAWHALKQVQNRA